jgi:hypothetical protein
MPAPPDDVEVAGEESLPEAAAEATSEADLPMQAAALLRSLAERIEARHLRLPTLPAVRSDAALLTVVLAALLNADGAGAAGEDVAPSDAA